MKNPIFAGIALLTTIFAVSSLADDAARVDVAEFDGEGNLIVPAEAHERLKQEPTAH